MPKFVNHLVRVEDILGSTHDDGELRVNLGDRHTGKGNGASQPVWGMPGFAARPRDPDQDGCAQAYYIVDGNTKRIVAYRDNRFTKFQPELKPGETSMYGSWGQFIRCHEDGGISMFTTTSNGSETGQSLFLRLSPEEGLEVHLPWGYLTFGPKGFHVLHSSGARLDLGAIGGLPGPLGILKSYAKLQGDVASLKGAATSVGSDGGLTNEIATTEIGVLLGILVTALVGTVPANGGSALTTALAATPYAGFTPAQFIALLISDLNKVGKIV